MQPNNNDVVIVELDRPRELRFGHKALKKLMATTGKSIEEATEEFDMEELEKIFFYGLERDARDKGETLTLEMMEDILDHAPSYDYLMNKMQLAMNNAMGGMGNAPKPPAPAAAGKAARGK